MFHNKITNEMLSYDDVCLRLDELDRLRERMACKSDQVIKYDPDCDHDADPIEKAMYIVADNILKHLQTAKPWDCQDACWLEALTEARKILKEWKDGVRETQTAA